MGSLALDGIGGFPTANLVNGLMRLEARALIPFQERKSSVSNEVKALQALNAKMSSITTNAFGVLGRKDKYDVGDPSKVWQAAKGTSSHKTVEVNAKPGAQVGSIEFNVKQLAQSKQLTISGVSSNGKTSALKDLSDRIMEGQPPALSVVVGDKVTTIKPASGSAADIARAINSAKDAGVTATAVRVGDGKYVLQITGKTTGTEDGDFKLYVGDLNAAVGLAPKEGTNSADSPTKTYDKGALQLALASGPAGVELFDESAEGVTRTREPQDAIITLWANGDGQGTELVSGTNTFENVMPDVDITIGKEALDKDGNSLGLTPGKVKVEVATDPSAAAEKVNNLLGSLNLVVDEISSQSRPVDKTRREENGSVTTYKAPGVLGSSSVAREINNRLRSLMGGGVTIDGKEHSLAEFGIKLKDAGEGKLHLDLDKEAFEKALRDDPKKVEQALTDFATRVSQMSSSYSDSSKGILSQDIKTRQDYQKDINDQIENMNDRLDRRKRSLELQFARLQQVLQRNQAQGNWLAGQLAGLPRMGQ